MSLKNIRCNILSPAQDKVRDLCSDRVDQNLACSDRCDQNTVCSDRAEQKTLG